MYTYVTEHCLTFFQDCGVRSSLASADYSSSHISCLLLSFFLRLREREGNRKLLEKKIQAVRGM